MDAARRKVTCACELLTSPTPANLDLCAELLQSAVADVPRIRSRREAAAVMEAVRRAGALLESAAKFHAEWQCMINVVCGGYEPGGGAQAVERRGTLSLAG